jgi:hypothetical protein
MRLSVKNNMKVKNRERQFSGEKRENRKTGRRYI